MFMFSMETRKLSRAKLRLVHAWFEIHKEELLTNWRLAREGQQVIAVTPQDDYSLLLAFEDGVQRVFDVRPCLDKGIFVELKDPTYFRQVRVAFNTVQWPHEQDLAPETLYLESKELVNAR